MYVYVYVYMYTYIRICICICIYIYNIYIYICKNAHTMYNISVARVKHASLCISMYEYVHMCMHIHRMHVKLQKTYKYVNVCVDLQHLWGHASNTSGSQKSSEAVDGHCSVWLAKRGVEPYKPPCLQCVTAWNLLIWLEELMWSRQTFSERMVLYSFEFPFTWQWRE